MKKAGIIGSWCPHLIHESGYDLLVEGVATAHATNLRRLTRRLFVMNLTCALVLQVRDGRLPVFQIPELHDRINAKVFEEHAKDDEPLVIVGKYAPDELDFLGHLAH